MADYSDAYNTPKPTRYEHELIDARLEARVIGFDQGFAAALMRVAEKKRAYEGSPLRCPLCEHYMYEETHECPRR